MLLQIASNACKSHYTLKLISGVKGNLYNDRAVATITAYKNGSKTQCARVVGSTLNDVRITMITLAKIVLTIIRINNNSDQQFALITMNSTTPSGDDLMI